MRPSVSAASTTSVWGLKLKLPVYVWWQVVDRGPPLPIYELIEIDRARGILMNVRELLYAEYLRLWTQVHPPRVRDCFINVCIYMIIYMSTPSS